MRSKRFSCLLALTIIIWSFAPKINWFVYAINKPGSYPHLSAFNKITFAPSSQIIDQQSSDGTITTIAGNGIEGFSGDGGPAASASLDSPFGVAIDNSGNLFIADTSNSRIRRVNTKKGVITTVAGNFNRDFSGDSGPAASASLNFPRSVTIDSSGNLFIADSGNNRIRRVNAATGIITTVAGNGNNVFSGDGGPAASASLDSPFGVAIDNSGNLFIADTSNNRIRRVNAATGIIKTVAGNGNPSFGGDNGPAASASLDFPGGVAIDSSGNLFIADAFNDRIRRIDAATGIITTVAGNGSIGFSGDGGPATSARLSFPRGVAIDSSGNLFIADSGNNRIRRVNAATGIITTVAGNSNQDFSGDGGPATSAGMDPSGIAIDSSGNLFIADRNNNRIRKVTFTGAMNGAVGLSALPSAQTVTAGGSAAFTVSLNRTNFAGVVDLSVSGLPSGASSTLNPISTTGNTSALTINTSSSTPAGTYSLTISGTANGASVSQTTTTLIVNAAPQPDFTLGIGPQSQSAIAGESKSFTVSLQGLNGFTQSVTLSAAVNPPTGVTATLTSSSVAPGNNVTLNVNTTSSTSPASYMIIITGTAGQLVRTQTATLTVSAAGDFTLNVSPNSRSIQVGDSTSYTVSAQGLNGFVQSVSLSATVNPSSGITATFTSSSVVPGNNVMLNVNTTSSTSPASYMIIITGTAGQLVRTQTATLTVSAAGDFTLNVSPNSQSVAAGQSTTYSVSVQAINGFSQAVNLSASVTPQTSNVAVNFSSNTLAPGSSATMTVNTNPSTATSAFTINVTAASGQLVQTRPVTLNVSQTAASDFSLMVLPGSQSITAGTAATFMVSLQATGGFNQTVNLNANVNPPNELMANFVSSTITPGGSAPLMVSSTINTKPGNYNITITGTAGQTVRTATATVNVAGPQGRNFSIISSPTSRDVNAGDTTNFTVKIESIGGFNETVTLSATASPNDQNIRIDSISPNPVNPSESATLRITTTPNLQPNSYIIDITGRAGGGLLNQASAIVNVTGQGFTLSFDKPQISVVRGGTETLTVLINRTGGFNGIVTVTPDKDQLSAMKIKAKPPSMSAAGTSITFTLKVKKTAQTGQFGLKFVGRDDRGGLSREQTLMILIQ